MGTATVDRVLNGRPGVNAETTSKVLLAIEALGMPTIQRGRPRLKKNLRSAYVLPKGNAKFLDLLERRIALQASEFRHQNITEVTYTFDAEDTDSFARELSALKDCEGLAILAPDTPAVKQAINDKVTQGVHVVTLLSDVAGSMREVYIGPDNRAAGRTAALLLGRMAVAGARNTMVLLHHATRLSSDAERRFGFMQKIEEDYKHVAVVRAPELPADEAHAHQVLLDFFQSTVRIDTLAGVYGPGGQGTAGVVSSLKQLGVLD
ncbi:MAG: LacI family DNA-binding transcriptional regulator [Rhodoferax sp.]|nr:LacI family DNA-binding transcriptional regulator [Rhodoferax sp.]